MTRYILPFLLVLGGLLLLYTSLTRAGDRTDIHRDWTIDYSLFGPAQEARIRQLCREEIKAVRDEQLKAFCAQPHVSCDRNATLNIDVDAEAQTLPEYAPIPVPRHVLP